MAQTSLQCILVRDLHWKKTKGQAFTLTKNQKGQTFMLSLSLLLGLVGGGGEAYSKGPARGELALASFAQNFFL